MIPASSKGGGQCMAFPDVCKVPAPPAPPIPTPFPNVGMLPQANGCSTKVKISNMPAVTKASEIPMSSGDEAGTLGGMVSNTIKGPVKFKKGSGKVKIEGKEAIYLGCMTGQNGSNANMPAGAQIAPSQVKVLVAP